MATQMSDYYTNVPEYSRREWDRDDFVERAGGLLSHPAAFTLAGLAIGALVVAAGIYFGPDAKRYLKMRSM